MAEQKTVKLSKEEEEEEERRRREKELHCPVPDGAGGVLFNVHWSVCHDLYLYRESTSLWIPCLNNIWLRRALIHLGEVVYA